MAAITLDAWVDALQSRGRYTFLRTEAIKGSGLSPEAVKKALQRMVSRRRVVKVKDYFYVIVPLEYLNSGGPPSSWFVDDLMKAMKLPYYVGLLSAAGIHGASHQQPQVFQVLTVRPVRPLQVGRARLRFFASKNAAEAAVQGVKTPTGTMRVSTPESTVVDLIRFAKAAGHLDNVATVIADLVPVVHPARLLKALRLNGNVSTAQRLGYLLDQIRARHLSKPIHHWVERQSPRTVKLRPGRAVSSAPEDRRWHVLVSEPLEIDA